VSELPGLLSTISKYVYIHKQAFYNNLEGYLTVHLPHEIMWNANLMQQGNFIDILPCCIKLAFHFILCYTIKLRLYL